MESDSYETEYMGVGCGGGVYNSNAAQSGHDELARNIQFALWNILDMFLTFEYFCGMEKPFYLWRVFVCNGVRS